MGYGILPCWSSGSRLGWPWVWRRQRGITEGAGTEEGPQIYPGMHLLLFTLGPVLLPS